MPSLYWPGRVQGAQKKITSQRRSSRQVLRCCCCCRASCDVPVDSHRKKYSTARSSAHFVDQLPSLRRHRDSVSLDRSTSSRTSRSTSTGSRSALWHTSRELTFVDRRSASRKQHAIDGLDPKALRSSDFETVERADKNLLSHLEQEPRSEGERSSKTIEPGSVRRQARRR
jgi:hypothetical protein